ncbi:MAG: FAD-dependent oxidoreductase, partial [Balneolaceae bacterium]|nr:FAD-dependent oxidoreductase [Balneolaceae bacterium]
HSAYDGSGYALKGFIRDAYHYVSAEERKRLVLEKLEKLYGDRALHYISYRETVWRHEPFTFAEYREPIIPHQNNGNTIFKQSFWDGKLLISGLETATDFPGYMDGAVQSANRSAEMIKKHFGK